MIHAERRRIPLRVRRLALLAGLAVAGLAASDSGPRAADAASAVVRARPLLERVRAQLAGRAGLEAEFVQVSEWAALGEADTSDGTLTVTTGGLFRLEYRRPAGHRIGSDGSRVWTFSPEERQVLSARVRQTTGWGGLFLESLAEPADSLVRAVVTPEWGRVARVGLHPRAQWDLAELYVEIAIAPGLPVGYGYTDAEGNRIRFRFLKARFVASVPESLFRFQVPPGYELFETD